MATSEESPEMIDGYPKFECIHGNPITDDDKSEYEHSERFQEKRSLEYKVDIPDPLEEKYATQEMVKYKYHEEDPNIISEESDDEVEEGEGMKISEESDV